MCILSFQDHSFHCRTFLTWTIHQVQRCDLWMHWKTQARVLSRRFLTLNITWHLTSLGHTCSFPVMKLPQVQLSSKFLQGSWMRWFGESGQWQMACFTRKKLDEAHQIWRSLYGCVPSFDPKSPENSWIPLCFRNASLSPTHVIPCWLPCVWHGSTNQAHNYSHFSRWYVVKQNMNESKTFNDIQWIKN